MINKQRVQRFRALIHMVIVLVVVVPIVLLIVLCIRMMGMLGEMEALLGRAPTTSAAQQADLPSPQPENQSFGNLPEDGTQPAVTLPEPEKTAASEPEDAAASEPSSPPSEIIAAEPVSLSSGETEPAAADAPNPPEDATAAPVLTGGASPDLAPQDAGLYENPVTGL